MGRGGGYQPGVYVPLKALFIPPTLKKLEGHIAFGLSVCLSVCVCVRPLTSEWCMLGILNFMCIPHEKNS